MPASRWLPSRWPGWHACQSAHLRLYYGRSLGLRKRDFHGIQGMMELVLVSVKMFQHFFVISLPILKLWILEKQALMHKLNNISSFLLQYLSKNQLPYCYDFSNTKLLYSSQIEHHSHYGSVFLTILLIQFGFYLIIEVSWVIVENHCDDFDNQYFDEWVGKNFFLLAIQAMKEICCFHHLMQGHWSLAFWQN